MTRHPDPVDRITARQRQILVHLLRGQTREVIAKQLYLSRSTVNRDIRDMTDTLGASSPEALGALAYRAGVLGDEHFGVLPPRAAAPGAPCRGSALWTVGGESSEQQCGMATCLNSNGNVGRHSAMRIVNV